MNLFQSYYEKLRSIPPPGCGCHPSLLAVSNYGVMAGLSAEKIFSDVRGAIPRGQRRVGDREIWDAINKALTDHGGGQSPRTYIPKPAPIVKNAKAALQRIIEQGRIRDVADLWESSPVRIDWPPNEDTHHFLSFCFDPNDLVFIGERHDLGVIGETIRTAAEWNDHFRNGGKTSPHFIINPLNGLPVGKKSGDGFSLRSDGNIVSYRYCLVEFDELCREDQISFWSAATLPVCVLIDSAGKSIHALLDVQKLAAVTSADQWATSIKGHLYDRLLTPLGVDKACSNPARLSRLPGHYRTEKGGTQKLLWLGRKDGENDIA